MSLIFTRDPEAAKQRVVSIAATFGIAPLAPDFDTASGSLAELLELLPITSKRHLVSYGQDATDEYFKNGLLFSETSGTTSAPLQTPRSMRDFKWNTLNQLCAYKRYLQPSVDRVAVLHPSILSPFVEASACALQELGVGYVRVYPIPEVCEYSRIFDVFERCGITTIMSTPTLVYKLLYVFQRLSPARLPRYLKRLLLTGEYLSPASATNLQRLLGNGSAAMPFVYGASETATLMFGMPDGTYRAISEDFIFEVFPVTGSPRQPAGETGALTGRLVVTWLRQGLLPIVRYDTNDIFTVWKEPHTGDYVFRFDGRRDTYPIDLHQRRELENAIYSLGVPVFHFECKANATNNHLQIVIITESGTELQGSTAAATLRAQLEWTWSLTVAVNPPQYRFYEFSPTPKSNRFLTC